ncbi:MAG: tRNA dihydrouridine synthase DusB [Candidatus Saganbacteria bacterium]|nr:tRNA dihydrouridine synthase DusB [Candidatus Saganbacteria bacterium]
MVKIGNKKLPTNILMAPMSGCTDLSFRLIAREAGAKFCFFEMLDSNSLAYEYRQTVDEMILTIPKDKPIAAQLLGSDPEVMLKAAHQLLKHTSPVFIDINAACPVRKVVTKKAGSYLLTDPDRLFAIIKKLSKGINLPITVKLRIGYEICDQDEIIRLAKGCQKSGAKALFVHGRTMSQGYAGEIDYETIKRIKQSVKIPVFGSGNIFTPVDAKRMFDETGCDGIIVARGALGRPWIFKEIDHYFKSGKILPEQSLDYKLKWLKKHLVYLREYRQGQLGSKLGFMRKVVLWYLSYFRNSAKIRRMVVRPKTIDALFAFVDNVEDFV